MMVGPLVHSDRWLLSDPSIVQRITGQVLFLLVLETATWSAYLPEISNFKNISQGAMQSFTIGISIGIALLRSLLTFIL